MVGVFSTPMCQLYWWLIVILKLIPQKPPLQISVEIKWWEYSFVFPVYVHFEAGIVKAIKIALVLALSYPFHSISMFAAAAGFYFLAEVLPALLPFISFSLLGFSIMGIAHLAFVKAMTEAEKAAVSG